MENREKQWEKGEEELKTLRLKFQDLGTSNKNLSDSLKKWEGEEKKQAEEIDKLKGKLKNCEERNTSLEGDHSETKSAKGILEEERNFLLDEAKQREADLEQLQTKCEKIEQERDAAPNKVHAQKGAWRRYQESEAQKLQEVARHQQEKLNLDEGALAALPSLPTEETDTPRLDSLEDGDEASEDEAEDNQDTPKKASTKKRRRRRKPRGSNLNSPTKIDPVSPLPQVEAPGNTLQQFETPRSNISEAKEYPAPEDVALPSGDDTPTEDIIDEGGEEEEDVSDPDEGPSKVTSPNDDGTSLTMHKRPGRRNSKKDHKYEAEKRRRKREEKKAEVDRLA